MKDTQIHTQLKVCCSAVHQQLNKKSSFAPWLCLCACVYSYHTHTHMQFVHDSQCIFILFSVFSCPMWQQVMNSVFPCIWNVASLSHSLLSYPLPVCDACPLRPSELIHLQCRVFIQTMHVVVAPTPKRKGDETSPLSSLKENCSFHRNRSKSN